MQVCSKFWNRSSYQKRKEQKQPTFSMSRVGHVRSGIGVDNRRTMPGLWEVLYGTGRWRKRHPSAQARKRLEKKNDRPPVSVGIRFFRRSPRPGYHSKGAPWRKPDAFSRRVLPHTSVVVCIAVCFHRIPYGCNFQVPTRMGANFVEPLRSVNAIFLRLNYLDTFEEH